ATGGGPYAKSDFAPGPEFGLILGLSARLPMPRGRQLGTARWCHADIHPPAKLTTNGSLALHRGLRKRPKRRAIKRRADARSGLALPPPPSAAATGPDRVRGANAPSRREYREPRQPPHRPCLRDRRAGSLRAARPTACRSLFRDRAIPAWAWHWLGPSAAAPLPIRRSCPRVHCAARG